MLRRSKGWTVNTFNDQAHRWLFGFFVGNSFGSFFFFVVLKNIHLRRILTIQRWNWETLQHKYAHDLYERMKPKEKRMVQPRIIHLAIKRCVNTTNMEDMQSICNPFAVCNRQYLHSSQMKLHAIWQLSYLSEKNCIVPPLSNGLNFLFCAHVALLKRHYQQPKTPPPFSIHRFFDLWSTFKGKEKEGFTEELT